MRLFTLNIALLISFSAFCQDIHFSMYDEMPLNINPALAGNSSSTKRAGLIYRNQWNSVSSPFESSGVYGDLKIQHEKLNGANIGVGLLFLNDRSGSGGWQENQLYLAANYQKFIDKKQSLLLSAGPKIGFYQKGFDPSKLNFETDFTYETAAFTSNGNFENFGGSKMSVTQADLALGASLTKYNRLGQESIIGFAFSHLISPNSSFVNNDELSPLLFSIHASTVKSISRVLKVKPSMLYLSQNKAQNFIIGGQFIYSLGTRLVEETDLKAGAYIRTNDAVFFTFGINHDNWGINLAYDYNLSGLQQISSNVNALEIAITIRNKIFKSKTRKFILPGNRLL